MTATTQPVTVEDAAALAGLTYAWEVESAPDPSPMAGPSWLRASDGIDPRMPPYQYLLTRQPLTDRPACIVIAAARKITAVLRATPAVTDPGQPPQPGPDEIILSPPSPGDLCSSLAPAGPGGPLRWS